MKPLNPRDLFQVKRVQKSEEISINKCYDKILKILT